MRQLVDFVAWVHVQFGLQMYRLQFWFPWALVINYSRKIIRFHSCAASASLERETSIVIERKRQRHRPWFIHGGPARKKARSRREKKGSHVKSHASHKSRRLALGTWVSWHGTAKDKTPNTPGTLGIFGEPPRRLYLARYAEHLTQDLHFNKGYKCGEQGISERKPEEKEERERQEETKCCAADFTCHFASTLFHSFSLFSPLSPLSLLLTRFLSFRAAMAAATAATAMSAAAPSLVDLPDELFALIAPYLTLAEVMPPSRLVPPPLAVERSAGGRMPVTNPSLWAQRRMCA